MQGGNKDDNSYIAKILYWLAPQSKGNNYCVWVMVKGKTLYISISFVRLHNHFPLLTMITNVSAMAVLTRT